MFGEMNLKTEIELEIQWIKQEITLAKNFKANGSVGFRPMIKFIESEIMKVEDKIYEYKRTQIRTTTRKEHVMVLAIKSTPKLNQKQSDDFIKRVEAKADVESHPIPTPKLANFTRKLMKDARHMKVKL